MKILIQYIPLVLLVIPTGCDEFAEIDTPRTELVRTSVFKEASTAEAAVVDLYNTLKEGFNSGYPSGIGIFTSLSSDELVLFETNPNRQAINDNQVMPDNSEIESLWSNMYNTVYKVNAILEGLAISDIERTIKDQLSGEALFIRAYTYFYLVNLWGDVPLITSTDYQVNNKLVRTATTEVYEQIVSDLMDAQERLQEQYSGDRVRANSGAASALLARVYLYLNEWEKAEAEATKLIDNNLYSLEENLDFVFRKSSPEVILQLWNSFYPYEYVGFLVHADFGGPIYVSLRPEFLKTFAAEDLRYVSWVNEVKVSGTTFYGVNKYKSPAIPPEDYSTVFRLAEQYLIRAEARAQQNNLAEAINDLDVIRTRASLSPITAHTKQELLEAIYLERKHELFGEVGHRWLDLKRIGRANQALSPLKKFWDSEDTLYPIPESQIISNPAITQNPLGS